MANLKKEKHMYACKDERHVLIHQMSPEVLKDVVPWAFDAPYDQWGSFTSLFFFWNQPNGNDPSLFNCMFFCAPWLSFCLEILHSLLIYGSAILFSLSHVLLSLFGRRVIQRIQLNWFRNLGHTGRDFK